MKMHRLIATLAISTFLLIPAASRADSPAPYWNQDTAYPLISSDSGVWYLDTKSAQIVSNTSDSLIFSVSVLLVDPAKDPNAYEFSRYWFKKPQSQDKYAIYFRHGDGGDWTPLSLSDDAAPQNLKNLFLTGWQAATGFPYDTELLPAALSPQEP